MSFAVPWALVWLALAVPIVVFYILRVRLRQVPVSTTIFWQQIYDEKRPRSLWQYLRHLLSLLAQLLLLVLLALALADPFFTSDILAARRLILVVDNSASMQATDVAPTRLHSVKGEGRAIISGLRWRDDMAIIAAGAQPRVVCGLSGHERTLADALAGIDPSDGPTHVQAAIALARQLLGDAPHGRVVVLSDGCFAGSQELLDADDVELHIAGTRPPNVGITNFQVRRSLLDPIGYEIMTQVTNASEDEVKCRLEIDLNDAPVDVIPLELAAGQSWTRTIEKTSVEGGTLVARVRFDDPFPLDNTATALLPKRDPQRVVLVSEGNMFLRMALKANPLVDLQTAGGLPARYEPGVLYVFHRFVPPSVPDVNVLAIDPADSSDLWQVGDVLENPIVTKQAQDAELMRHVRLDNVLLPEARKMSPPEGATPLATALSGDPLYWSLDRGGRKLAVLSVNIDEGDLTFRTAFPIMVSNALAWFAGSAGELRESLSSGAVAPVELPDSSGRYSIHSPRGADRLLPPGIRRASVGPLEECGIWRVTRAGAPASNEKAPPGKSSGAHDAEPALVELACNLSSSEESDLRVPEALLAAREPASLAAHWLTRPIWFYLVGLAFVLVAAEWYLYQRRWIS